MLETARQRTVKKVLKYYDKKHVVLGDKVYEGYGFNDEKNFEFHINKFMELAEQRLQQSKSKVIGRIEFWK